MIFTPVENPNTGACENLNSCAENRIGKRTVGLVDFVQQFAGWAIIIC
jgi:hypothetical protein